MTDIGSPAPMTNSRRAAPRSSGWTGWLFFAAAMMMLNGVVWVIEGLMALVNDDYFKVTASGAVLSVDYTAWGFVHLLLGVAFFASGLGVLSGNRAARAVGIVLAGVNALVAMVFLEAAPGLGIIVIATDVLVIFALAVHGDEMRDAV
jgi:hypothetical protein